jgi:hypothetical protein
MQDHHKNLIAELIMTGHYCCVSLDEWFAVYEELNQSTTGLFNWAGVVSDGYCIISDIDIHPTHHQRHSGIIPIEDVPRYLELKAFR